MSRLTRDQMAARVARDIPEGAYVNLGIGLPTSVAHSLPADKEIFLQTDHGLLGLGPAPAPRAENPAPLASGHHHVTLLTFARFSSHPSFFPHLVARP